MLLLWSVAWIDVGCNKKSWSNNWSSNKGFNQSSMSSSVVDVSVGFKASKNSSLKWRSGEKESSIDVGGETDNEPNRFGLCVWAKSISMFEVPTIDHRGKGKIRNKEERNRSRKKLRISINKRKHMHLSNKRSLSGRWFQMVADVTPCIYIFTHTHVRTHASTHTHMRTLRKNGKNEHSL